MMVEKARCFVVKRLAVKIISETIGDVLSGTSLLLVCWKLVKLLAASNKYSGQLVDKCCLPVGFQDNIKY